MTTDMSANPMTPAEAVQQMLREHAEREWPGPPGTLNAGFRAIFMARGGHGPGQGCKLRQSEKPYEDPYLRWMRGGDDD